MFAPRFTDPDQRTLLQASFERGVAAAAGCPEVALDERLDGHRA